MKAKNIQEYLGSLQQTVVTSWRKHLKSSKHDEHVILNDFYDDMLVAVVELTEAYMAHNGKVEDYVNLFKDTKKMTAYEYVKAIYDFTKENRDLVGDESEIQGLVDDVLTVCDTAMYKLKELVGESQMIDLADFIIESLNSVESNILEARLSPEAKWIVANTIDHLQQMDNTVKDNDYKNITIEPRKDDLNYNVYYKGNFMDSFDVFPSHVIDADAIYNVMKELNWLKK